MDFSKINYNLKVEQLNPADLLSPDNFESIKYLAYNLIDYLDWDGALSFANVLAKKLSQVTPENEEQSKMHRVLSFWAMRLMLFVFINLRISEKTELLKNHALYLLQMNLDVKRYLVSYLDFFDDIDIINDEAKALTFDLKNNQEVLGKSDKFSKVNFRPTVANWFKEYQSTLFKLGETKEPGAFHIVKFMDSSNYVKFLDNEEKEILRDLLDLYNWLLSPLSYVVEKMTNSSKIPYVNSQKFELPQEVLEPSSVSLPPKLPPIVPAPKNLPTLKTFSEISNQPRAEGGRGNNPLSFIPNPLPKQVTEPTPRPTPSSVPTAIPKQPAPESQPVIIPPIESVQDRPFGRVNFQDILRNNNQEPLLRQGFGGQARTKNQGDEDATGLRWEEEREQISNNPSFAKASEGKQFQISNASPPPSLPPQGGGMGAGGKQVIQQKEQDKAGDIDRKLEELGKRIK